MQSGETVAQYIARVDGEIENETRADEYIYQNQIQLEHVKEALCVIIERLDTLIANG
jgi:hypothetical protein